MKCLIAALAFALTPLAGCATAPDAAGQSTASAPSVTDAGMTQSATSETAHLFEANSGDTAEAFRGVFTVPENRADPKSRMIEIHYVRFPATGANPGAPIVYLAGGPGGSGVGTARGRRFPLFMAMREFGDVIALDQRGTGWSQTAPRCTSQTVIPADRVIARAEATRLLRQAAEQCGAFWRAEGFDPAGYTTVESARDLDALRAHLGADKISLWGISYGTHLSLAAVKEMGPRLDRLVLASVEGLDQTVKLPARTDAYFARLQMAVDAQPAAKAAWPDIAALMRRTHARLDAEPVMLELALTDGPAPLLLTGDVMRNAASALIADPDSAALLLHLHSAVDAGEVDLISRLLSKFYTPGAPESFSIMPLAMDVASGIGAARLEQVNREAQTSLLGDVLNHPMPHLAGALGLDLGDEFRTPPVSDIPTLVLSGTLDGRTYPESQREAVARMSNVSIVTVVNAGHNLFMTTPEVTQTIQRFMRGEKITDAEITVDLPDFTKTPDLPW